MPSPAHSPDTPSTDTAPPRAAPTPQHWAGIRLFAMDVDGVLTDGTVQIASDGTETKTFSILDGMGLVRLGRAGIATAWISGRASEATTRRARELGIPHLVQGRVEKPTALSELTARLRLSPEQCAYMGDDDIDAAAIRWAGIGIAPSEAMPAALHAASYVTHRLAGRGAVREVCEHILNASASPRAANTADRAPATASATAPAANDAQAAR